MIFTGRRERIPHLRRQPHDYNFFLKQVFNLSTEQAPLFKVCVTRGFSATVILNHEKNLILKILESSYSRPEKKVMIGEEPAFSGWKMKNAKVPSKGDP